MFASFPGGYCIHQEKVGSILDGFLCIMILYRDYMIMFFLDDHPQCLYQKSDDLMKICVWGSGFGEDF